MRKLFPRLSGRLIWLPLFFGFVAWYNLRRHYLGNSTYKQNIITLEPYKSISLYSSNLEKLSLPMNFKEFDNAANNVTDSLSNYTFDTNLDDNSVTIEALENLSNYRIIILNTHGYSESGTTYFSITEKELKTNYEKYINRSIFPIDNNNGFIVTSSFFEEIYKEKPFNHSLIYLGFCKSMDDVANNDLVNTLIACGAETVVGFSSEVYTTYNRNLCETIFNELSNKDKNGTYRTIAEAVDKAKRKHGQVDKKHPKKTELILIGNGNFRLSDNLNEFADYTIYDQIVGNDFELSVYDRDKNLVTDYYLCIEKYIYLSKITTSLIYDDAVSNGSMEFHLSSGVYSITISTSEESQKIIQIVVMDKSQIPLLPQIDIQLIKETNRVDIYTEFEPIIQDATIFELDNNFEGVWHDGFGRYITISNRPVLKPCKRCRGMILCQLWIIRQG